MSIKLSKHCTTEFVYFLSNRLTHIQNRQGADVSGNVMDVQPIFSFGLVRAEITAEGGSFPALKPFVTSQQPIVFVASPTRTQERLGGEQRWHCGQKSH